MSDDLVLDCKHHGPFNPRRAVACPECMREVRARLAEAEWLLGVTWELETNQYKYPVDEYGERLEAFVKTSRAADSAGEKP